MKDNVGFFVTPPNKEGETSYATGSYGWCLHVSSKAKNPDVAAAFLDWISNEAAATEFFKSGDIAPVLADNPPLKPGKLTSDIYNAWTSVLKNDALLSYLDFATPSAGEIEYPTFQSIIGGKVTPAEGLATIQTAREKFLSSQK
jgi:raffinose/stachyose/melibiose transport system substrate-binding protein